MVKGKKIRTKRPNFNQPLTLPIEVRQQVIELNELKRIAGQYFALFEELPSFQALTLNIETLQGNLEEIQDFIGDYLDPAVDLDFKAFEFEMANLIADSLEESLDNYPDDGTLLPKKQSQITLRDDADALMENVWHVIRVQGYRLHTALIRA